jgi:hypothetical protein
MRDKFIELIQNAVGGCARYWAKIISDHLIENNVTLLPCKVGDTIYVVFSQFKPDIMECKVDELSIQKDGIYAVVDLYYPNHVARRNTSIPEWWFGRFAFFSKEEAERKIKENREWNW